MVILFQIRHFSQNLKAINPFRSILICISTENGGDIYTEFKAVEIKTNETLLSINA